MECWACGFLTPGSEGLQKLDVRHVSRICPGGWGFTLLRGEGAWKFHGRSAGLPASLTVHPTTSRSSPACSAAMLQCNVWSQMPCQQSRLHMLSLFPVCVWVHAGSMEVPEGLDMELAACGWDSFVACTSQGSVCECTLQASPEVWAVAMPSTAALSALSVGEKHR